MNLIQTVEHLLWIPSALHRLPRWQRLVQLAIDESQRGRVLRDRLGRAIRALSRSAILGQLAGRPPLEEVRDHGGAQLLAQDLDTATLTPRQQLQRGELSPLKTKGSGKPIAIAGFVVDAFRAHRDHQQFECSAGDMGLVFTEWNGVPLVARDLRRDFKRHIEEAGVPVIVWHAMRHYAATFFTTETMAPRQVAATLLRHSPAMLDRYSHTRIEQQREPVEAMGQALAGA